MMPLFDSDLDVQMPLLTQLDPEIERGFYDESLGATDKGQLGERSRQRTGPGSVAEQVYARDSAQKAGSDEASRSPLRSGTVPGTGEETHQHDQAESWPQDDQALDSTLAPVHHNGAAQPQISETALNSKAGVISDGNGNGTNGNGTNGNGTATVLPPREARGADEESEQGFLPVLKNRNFLALWSGQVFSQLADKVYLVLMIALIASRFQTEGQTISGWVSSIMIAFTIPAVLFGSVAGVFVDRWPKKEVLVFTNLLRGVLVLVLLPLLWLSQGWSPFAGLPIGFIILLIITFLVSTLTQFFAPAEQAAIPLVVERKHLLSANSLYTTTMMASVIVGFAVGEPLLAIADTIGNRLVGTPDLGKEILVGFSYAIAGGLLIVLRTGENADHMLQKEQPHVWQDIKDGLRYLKEQKRVRAALIQLVILFSIFAALAVLAVRLAEIMPAIKASQFGFLLAAGGVGMAIGATLLGNFGQRFSRAQLSLYGSLGVGASLAALSFTTWQLVPTLLLLVLLGGCAAIAGIPMQTAIHEETPEEMRGKVFGLQNNAVNIALSLPLALAGVAETLFGLNAVFLSLAIISIAGGCLTWYISRSGSPKKA